MTISSFGDLKSVTSRFISRIRIPRQNTTPDGQSSPILSRRSSLESTATIEPDQRYGVVRKLPKMTNLPVPPKIIDDMMSMSKLETFKFNHLAEHERLKERLLRSDVYMDPQLKYHIKGQILQLDLQRDTRCRFPNMNDVAYLVCQDMLEYGEDSRRRGGIVGDTKNSRVVRQAFLPVYGFDDKKVTFWFRHQKVFRKIVCDELEELVMVNRYTQMRPDWIDYHDKFWMMSDTAMSALNIMAFLIYSLKVPVAQFTHQQPYIEVMENDNH